MIQTQNTRVQIMLDPGATLATNATATGWVDTRGYDYCSVIVAVGTSSSAALTALKLMEGSATNSTTAIVALTGGTATSSSVGFVIPTHATNGTSTSQAYAVMNVDCRKRARYLVMNLTPAATNTVTALAVLSRADEMPSGTAATGENAAVIVDA